MTRSPAVALATAVLLCSTVPGWAKPTPCPVGRFALDAPSAAALGTLLGISADALELNASGQVQLADCVTAGKVRAKAKVTKISARWSTCGTGKRVKLKARIAAPACDAMQGKVSARKAGRKAFSATRDTGSGPTTTVPVFCGNGVRDGADQCEGNDGCITGQRCTASCTCETVPPAPTTSRGLIAAALAAGTIDHPTSLVYRAWALFADSRLPPEYDGQAWEFEDTGLFREVRRVWDTLSPATQADLQPFLLRPTEVGSYWSPPPAPSLVRPAAAGDPPPIDCAYAPGAPLPDWRSTESTHFVVWSCGGGDLGQDPYATQRTITASVFEQAWTAMKDEVGVPEPDDLDVGPAPTNRIDVYVLKTNMCKSRGGVCVPIPVDDEGTPALAAVATTPPCKVGVTGAQASSSFVLVDVDQVTPASSAWLFRYVMAHEYFHVLENALNLQAQGGGCDADGTVDDTVSSWLVEASAEWAAWAYFGPDGPSERERLFTAFQDRDPAFVSLRSIGVPPEAEYQAFLYPFFVQQERGRAPVAAVWKSSGRARTPAQLDDLLNDALPFAERYRDFGVRSFDTTLPGAPIAPTYQAVSGGAIPPDVKPLVLQPDTALNFPGELSRPVLMQALTAQYEHFTVDEHIRSVKLDFQELGNSGFVQADVLANVQGTWKRIRVPGLVFEFCRDEPADDIAEFYLILSHHDRREGSQATGSYKTTSRFECPTGWSGTIHSVLTLTEHSERNDAAGSSVHDEREREVQQWSVVATTERSNVAQQPFDQLELRWNARYEQEVVDQNDPTACLDDIVYGQTVYSGSGSDTDRLGAFPLGGGAYSLSPTEATGNQYDISGAYSFTRCQSGSSSFPLMSKRNDVLGLLFAAPGLAMLQPDPMDAKRYTGTATILHDEQDISGGTQVIDLQATWDLRRR